MEREVATETRQAMVVLLRGKRSKKGLNIRKEEGGDLFIRSDCLDLHDNAWNAVTCKLTRE